MTGRGFYSRYRIVFLTVLLMVGMVAVGRVYAQTAGGAAAAPAAETPKGPGLLQLIIGHWDFITVTIGILSVVSMALIIQGFLRFRQDVFMPASTLDSMREMITAKRYPELIQYTQTEKTFVAKCLEPALRRAPKYQAMKDALETSIGEQTADEFRKVEYLNIIGNLGPLLGLLGTVMGMIYAFSEMKAAGGNAKPDQLAGGIATALAHTFMGLFLAVPCLAAYGILRTKVDQLTVKGAIAADDLLTMMRPEDGAAPARATPAGTPATSRAIDPTTPTRVAPR